MSPHIHHVGTAHVHGVSGYSRAAKYQDLALYFMLNLSLTMFNKALMAKVSLRTLTGIYRSCLLCFRVDAHAAIDITGTLWQLHRFLASRRVAIANVTFSDMLDMSTEA